MIDFRCLFWYALRQISLKKSSMSGHSKWSQIKRQKGVADIKRGVLFTRLANTITVAARAGGGDPEFNFSLRLEIDKAKSANMPKENIDRAIKRGTGELTGAKIEEVLYEGFGPAHAAVIIEVLTDNKNRTVSALKHIFTKYHGNFGSQNSVMWMFDHLGAICIQRERIPQEKREALELLAIDAGAINMKEDNEDWLIFTPPSELKKFSDLFTEQGVPPDSAELEFVPKEPLRIQNESELMQLKKFFEEVEDMADVNTYYTNVPDELL